MVPRGVDIRSLKPGSSSYAHIRMIHDITKISMAKTQRNALTGGYGIKITNFTQRNN